MRGGIDAVREAGNDREPRFGERTREIARGGPALRRRHPAADDRQRGRVEQRLDADVEQHRRRVADVEQRARIGAVVPRDQMVRRVVEPAPGGVEVGRGNGRQRGGCDGGGHVAAERRRGRVENRGGIVERPQQRHQRALGKRLVRQRGPRERARIERHGAGGASARARCGPLRSDAAHAVYRRDAEPPKPPCYGVRT